MSKSFKKFLLYTLYLTLHTFSVGCVATRQDVIEIQRSVKQMQKQLNEFNENYKQSNNAIQKNQVNLKLGVEEAGINVQILEEKLEESKNEISKLSQRVDNLEIKVNQLQQQLSAQQTSTPETLNGRDTTSKQVIKPTDLYQIAYTDYVSQNYDLSIVGFREYLKKYPQTEFSPSAQYWIGECYYSKAEFEKAIAEFDKVIEVYPRSAKIPAAKLKKAFALYEMNKKDDAKKILKQIIDDYSTSAKEVKLAKEKLKTIEQANPR